MASRYPLVLDGTGIEEIQAGDVQYGFFGEITESVYSLTGTVIDPANGSIQTKTLGANTTFTESLDAGQTVILMITGGNTYTITWPTITWVTSAGNIAPTQTASDVYVVWKVSTTLYGAYVGSYA